MCNKKLIAHYAINKNLPVKNVLFDSLDLKWLNFETWKSLWNELIVLNSVFLFTWFKYVKVTFFHASWVHFTPSRLRLSSSAINSRCMNKRPFNIYLNCRLLMHFEIFSLSRSFEYALNSRWIKKTNNI